MNSSEEVKKMVNKKYSEIARKSIKTNQQKCCCSDKSVTFDFSIMADDYRNIEGYVPGADLGLGCGLPTEFSQMKEGNTVLDLGSGAGNDVFIARRVVGEKGKVIGIDFSEDMISKARENCEKLSYKNVEFRMGEIEKLPVGGNSIDVVLSNCVLNLVPDKKKAFMEIYRILRAEGKFCVSDIVLNGELPEKLRTPAELYAGCVAGAIPKNDYLNIINNVGFVDIKVVKEKEIIIPDHILIKYFDEAEIKEYKSVRNPISSITVYAEKKVKCCC